MHCWIDWSSNSNIITRYFEVVDNPAMKLKVFPPREDFEESDEEFEEKPIFHSRKQVFLFINSE